MLLESLHESKVACDILIPPLPPPPPPSTMDVTDSPLRSSFGLASALTRRPRVTITPGPSYNNHSTVASSGRIDSRGATAARQLGQPSVAAIPPAPASRDATAPAGAQASPSAFVNPAFEARAAGDPTSTAGGDRRTHLKRGSSESSVLAVAPSGAAARDRGAGGVGAVGDDLGRALPAVTSRMVDGRGSQDGGVGGPGLLGASQTTEVAVSAPAEKEDCAARATALQGFREGDLQCGRKYSRRFSLNHRLHGATVLHELRRTALAPFAVHGRSGLYVYLDGRRNVFYLTLSEVRTAL